MTSPPGRGVTARQSEIYTWQQCILNNTKHVIVATIYMHKVAQQRPGLDGRQLGVTSTQMQQNNIWHPLHCQDQLASHEARQYSTTSRTQYTMDSSNIKTRSSSCTVFENVHRMLSRGRSKSELPQFALTCTQLLGVTLGAHSAHSSTNGATMNSVVVMAVLPTT